MTLDDPNCVVVGKEPILDGDRVLGYATSANYGHSIGRGIVYGYLPIDHAAAGTKVDVLYFGERLQATVANEPIYDPGRQADEGVSCAGALPVGDRPNRYNEPWRLEVLR